MFTANTCFVLGAGVSQPFGFPVREMQKAICDSGHIATTDLVDILSRILPADKSHVADKLIESFKNSDVYSIDNWLETNQADADLLTAGKYAIAAVIMNAEAMMLKRDDGYVEGDWFAWLWNQMRTQKIEHLNRNNVRVITFNYDRLFEWKLNRQIRNTYLQANGEAHKEAFDWMQTRIVHAHGALGDSGDLLKDYGQFSFYDAVNGITKDLSKKKSALAEAIREHSKAIDIVCENPNHDTKLIKKAQEWLKEADKVIFLGFSYDKRNLEKLKIKQLASAWPKSVSSPHSPEDFMNNKVIGTAMGLGPAERRAIRTLSTNTIGLDSSDLDALTFCRHFVEAT